MSSIKPISRGIHTHIIDTNIILCLSRYRIALELRTIQAFNFIVFRLYTISVFPELDNTSTSESSTMVGNTEQAAPIDDISVSAGTVSPSLDSANSEA